MDKLSELIFNEENHTYTVDGVKYPSVTEIVAPLGQDYDENPQYEDKIDAAAERGVICHEILAQLITGDSDIEFPSVCTGYIDAIELFLAEHTIIPYAIEKPIYGKEIGVAGTPDLLCEFDGELTLLDYKFVSQIAKSKVKAQLNGYSKLYEENGIFPSKLKAVQFLPNGIYRIYPVAIDDKEFMDCMEIYRAKNKRHPKGRIE